MHDGLAGTLAECVVKVGTVVLGQIVTGEGLTAVFVDTLKNLVTSGVTKTGEKRGELGAEGSGGVLLEDNLVQASSGGDLRQRTISPKHI